MSLESAAAFTPASPPQTNPNLLQLLRTDLLQANYTVDTLNSLLSADASLAIKREISAPAVREYSALWADQQNPAALLANVFTLGQAASEADINVALPSLGLKGAIELGILQPAKNGNYIATVDLRPYQSADDLGEFTWFIASDLTELATGAPLKAEHVLGIGGATATLINITPRVSTNTALDLGTGCGIQALHAARHIQKVVATDISQRALDFTRFNLELNRETLPSGHEIETRLGSMLEPVAGEHFDLIVSNPPFVITPRKMLDGEASEKWTYRDGGKAGDKIVEDLLRDAPNYLAPGGYLAMLANWEIQEELDGGADGATSETAEEFSGWSRRPKNWLEDAAVNTVVIQREVEDPISYAATWLRDGGVIERDPNFAPMLYAWLDDFASRSVSGIGFGHVLMHKPQPDKAQLNTAQADASPAKLFAAISTTGSGALGPNYLQMLKQQAFLQNLSDADFRALKLQLAADVVERRHYKPGSEDPMLIELVQGAFLGRVFQLDTHTAGIIGLLSGDFDLQTLLDAYFSYIEAAGVEFERTQIETNILDNLREFTLWRLLNPQSE